MRKHKTIWKYLAQALMASRPDKDLKREHRLGAIGICQEGRIFKSRNCSVHSINHKIPSSHAEARLSKRLPPESTVFVARFCWSGKIGLAKPCPTCQARLRSARVKTVYYTIDEHTYGVMKL